MTTTKQEEQQRDEKGRIIGGTPPVGFHTNPERRHNGAWKKEETARYKLELIIKMSDTEVQELIDDPATPLFDKRMAEAVQKGQWKELEGMINQVYGKPKESVDISNPDGSLTPIVRIIDDRSKAA